MYDYYYHVIITTHIPVYETSKASTTGEWWNNVFCIRMCSLNDCPHVVGIKYHLGIRRT